MILECRDLSKSFYTKKALNEVSLKLEGGKIYGLLGENGSGKTTWMKIISGLTKPTSGEILFKEHPWFYGDKAEIAYVSTEPFFYSFLDVNGVGQYYKDFFPDFDEKKFHEMVRRMSLEGKMKVKELSTGMTAKLKVIATLSRKAELYLLDEPFNGIDYKAKEEILGMILESANEKNTFVISTHMIDEIEVLSMRQSLSKMEKLCVGCQWKKNGCKVENPWQIFIWRSCRKNKGRMRKEKERKQNGTLDQI